MRLPARLGLPGILETRGLLRGLLLGSFGAAVYTAAMVAIPLVTGSIIDKALVARDSHALLVRVIALVGAAMTCALAKGVYQTAFTWLGERARADLLVRLLARIHELPIAFFDRESSGRIQSLVTEDGSSVARLSSQILLEALLGTLQLGLILAVVATRYGGAVLAVLVLIPIYAAFPLLLSRRMRDAAREALAATAEVYTVLHESIQAVREVKLFGRESWSLERLSRRLADEVSRQLRLMLLRAVYGLDYAVYFMVAGAVYWWGGRLVVAGHMTVGELLALVLLLTYLDAPVNRLTHLGTEYQRVRAATGRIEAMTTVELGRPGGGTVELGPGGHRITCEAVKFRYAGAETPALRGISFAVEPGQRVAIVGPSGAGKSTLVSLLARFHEPQEGRILIDGRDIRSYSLTSLRREIGFVLQDTMLFAGTVRENLRFGKLDATAAEMEGSSRLANAHPFIERLPHGYDSEVGERGVQLSAGQRQRIGIARVLLRQPGTLVLDEAMSALDTGSERIVREGLERLMARRTTFVVSHRPSAFASADRIIVLDGGRIVATGRHEELVAASAIYRSLLGNETPADFSGEDQRIEA